MDKMPCATCETMCEDAKGLYQTFKMLKGAPGVTIEKGHLTCPKTGLSYEVNFRHKEE